MTDEGFARDFAVGQDRSAGLVTLGVTGPAGAPATGAIGAAGLRQLPAAFERWSRDPATYAVIVAGGGESVFCAGLDPAEASALRGADGRGRRVALAADAYRLFWRIECFTKPTVALIDGPVAGWGVGLSIHGTHRVAGRGYGFAAAQGAWGTAIDAGLTAVLARLPDQVGVYLALSGTVLGRADAWRLGLVSHCIEAEKFPDIQTRLADADPVDALLDGLHADPGAGVLDALRPAIARCFSAATLAEIVARLDGERGVARAWAAKTATSVRSLPNAALLLAQLRHAQRRLAERGDGKTPPHRRFDVRDALLLEHRLLQHELAAQNGVTGDDTVQLTLLARAAEGPLLPGALELPPRPQPLSTLG